MSNTTSEISDRWGRLRHHTVRQAPLLLGVLALLCTLLLRVYDPAPLQQLRLAQFDLYQRLAPRDYDPQARVLMVDIDEESIERLGQWPWPRTRQAELVERLTALGVAAIGFSVLFPDPDQNSPRQILEHLHSVGPVSAAVERQLLSLPDPDGQFAEALRQSERAVLGVTGIADAYQQGGCITLLQNFRNSGWVYSAAGRPSPMALPRFNSPVCNLPILHRTTAGVGMLSVVPDADGGVRRLPLLTSVTAVSEPVPGLTAELLRVAEGERSYTVRTFEDGDGTIRPEVIKLGNFQIPTTPDGQLWLYETEAAPERHIPAWKVLQEDPARPSRQFQDHLVVIGVSAEGLGGRWATPLHPVTDAGRLHVQLLEQLRLGVYLERPDWAMMAELLLQIMLGLLVLGLIISRLSAASSSSIVILVSLWAPLLSWLAFYNKGLLLDAAYPTLVVYLVALVVTTAHYVRDEVEKRSLGRYLDPRVWKALKEDPELSKPGGRLQELTLFFCDIRSFTSISEKLSPNELIRLLNRFLTPMTDTLQNMGSCVDKYMGDAIMAFWNAPFPQQNHATRACHAALDMLARLQLLNEQTFKPQFDVEIRIGIGLNTGECCVGNLGSEKRFNYSVIGDPVNLASRLEGLTKQYRVSIITGEHTAALARGCRTLELDRVRVVGKNTPESIYTVLERRQWFRPIVQHAWWCRRFNGKGGWLCRTFCAGPGRTEAQPDRTRQWIMTEEAFAQLQPLHSQFLQAYRGQEWEMALRRATECMAIAGELIGYYEIMMQRIEVWQQTPPGADWDGVWNPSGK